MRQDFVFHHHGACPWIFVRSVWQIIFAGICWFPRWRVCKCSRGANAIFRRFEVTWFTSAVVLSNFMWTYTGHECGVGDSYNVHWQIFNTPILKIPWNKCVFGSNSFFWNRIFIMESAPMITTYRRGKVTPYIDPGLLFEELVVCLSHVGHVFDTDKTKLITAEAQLLSFLSTTAGWNIEILDQKSCH